MASLDPRMPVFDLIAEPLGVFKYGAKATEDRVNELLRLVGLEPGARQPLSRSSSPVGSGSASASPGPWPWSRS